MDEKLIIAVSGVPELFDASLFVYRDNRKLGGRLQTLWDCLVSCSLGSRKATCK